MNQSVRIIFRKACEYGEWREWRIEYVKNCGNHLGRYAKFYHSKTGVYGYKPQKRKHFEGISPEKLANRTKYSNFYRLITAYREHAHKEADVDPVALDKPIPLPELRVENFGLKLTDKVCFEGLLPVMDKSEGTVEEAIDLLKKIYTGNVGMECSYLETEEEREWFIENFEKICREPVDDATRKIIAKEMLKMQVFENFLATKFGSYKRYGGEGAESMAAFFHEFLRLALEDDLKCIVLCMPHRGRLSLLANMLHFPLEKLFQKLKGFSEFPEGTRATGDVTAHFTASTEFESKGKKLHLSMLYNPSHLEAVNPVSMGKTRALMQEFKDGFYSEREDARWSEKVLNLQVHGDAAYAGQGINQESLALSRTPHFEIGGSVHLVVNNQLGFTTPATVGRSSRYCTDLAKFISAPVIHVNADDPEMVLRTTKVAFKYQRKFRKDVFVDLNCFRRWGHNELDEPTFTNPLTYKIVNNRKSIPDKYLDLLTTRNIMSKEEGKSICQNHSARLTEALRQADSYVPKATYLTGRWSSLKQAEHAVTTWDTGVDGDLLKHVARKSVELKSGLNLHPTLLKSHVQARINKLDNNLPIDWVTAEAMALGSLLYSGYNVRFSGQDVGRGTFSHRHAMFVDQSTGEIHIPLNEIANGQTGKIELANSILSEEAVLGYEYGVSVTSPSTLVIWEAQFGDFFNGAQLIIDTFVSSGETKWMMSSGLVMVLPHGYDGAGPEHSSCRIERFLQITDSRENEPDGDDVNMHVVNPTTAAQYFHLLRRQMVRSFRKPLIVVGPKILLRHAAATSALSDMAAGSSFQTIIGDDTVNENCVKKVILVSGKHYYALVQQREKLGVKDIAIVRVESLCPFPVLDLMEEIQKYKHAKTFIWSQEEPRNMGAWSFMKPRFENLCGRRLSYSGREPLAAPAVGIGKLHLQQVEQVIEKPFELK